MDWLRGRQNQFLGAKTRPKSPKIAQNTYSQTAGCRKLVEPSIWLQDLIYYGRSETSIHLSGSLK